MQTSRRQSLAGSPFPVRCNCFVVSLFREIHRTATGLQRTADSLGSSWTWHWRACSWPFSPGSSRTPGSGTSRGLIVGGGRWDALSPRSSAYGVAR